MMNSITPTWFEKIYAAADAQGSSIPWANLDTSPDLVEWLDEQGIDGTGQTAVVVGCGLGDDAEELARRGFAVVAFDIAPTAVKMCQVRFPHSAVQYQVADLFAPPEEWYGRYDFVLEYFNLQALPPDVQPRAMTAMAALAAPGGTVLVINLGCDHRNGHPGPPWPLVKSELVSFYNAGLQEVAFEEYDEQVDAPVRRFRVEYKAVVTNTGTRPKTKPAEHLGDMAEAFAAFQATYPAFATTQILDEVRQREYGRLDAQDHVYLDYTGGTLYGECQLRAHWALLDSGIYGNPHSHNLASAAATALIEQTRAHVLGFFKASPEEYAVIFAANATGALKLVGEAYPFSGDSRYTLIFDNHNSVNGIREFARAGGTTITYLPLSPPELRVDEQEVMQALAQAQPGQNNLFAYPAQSNFSGVQHPLSWIAAAQERGWDVLLDASAFVPTNYLDLSGWQPDFVAISFYKMFGYPTGIGCLLARKKALVKLKRPWFAGGTIVLSSVVADAYHLADDEAAFEDGTVNYLGIPAVEAGLKFLSSLGMETIHQRISCLTAWLLRQLQLARHSNRMPLAVIYGPTEMERRGGTIAFNLYDPYGNLFDYRRVEELANGARISLRAGCFCNPGSAEISGGLTREDMKQAFHNGTRVTHREFITALRQINGKSSGAVRISVGLVSNFADVYRFMQFVRSFQDRAVDDLGGVEVENVNCRIMAR